MWIQREEEDVEESGEKRCGGGKKKKRKRSGGRKYLYLGVGQASWHRGKFFWIKPTKTTHQDVSRTSLTTGLSITMNTSSLDAPAAETKMWKLFKAPEAVILWLKMQLILSKSKIYRGFITDQLQSPPSLPFASQCSSSLYPKAQYTAVVVSTSPVPHQSPQPSPCSKPQHT